MRSALANLEEPGDPEGSAQLDLLRSWGSLRPGPANPQPIWRSPTIWRGRPGSKCSDRRTPCDRAQTGTKCQVRVPDREIYQNEIGGWGRIGGPGGWAPLWSPPYSNLGRVPSGRCPGGTLTEGAILHGAYSGLGSTRWAGASRISEEFVALECDHVLTLECDHSATRSKTRVVTLGCGHFVTL